MSQGVISSRASLSSAEIPGTWAAPTSATTLLPLHHGCYAPYAITPSMRIALTEEGAPHLFNQFREGVGLPQSGEFARRSWCSKTGDRRHNIESLAEAVHSQHEEVVQYAMTRLRRYFSSARCGEAITRTGRTPSASPFVSERRRGKVGEEKEPWRCGWPDQIEGLPAESS